MDTSVSEPVTKPLIRRSGARSNAALLLLLTLWVVIFFASLFAPPLLDDADATHANAARHMALSGDWVTLRVNGVRYLEKAPLPYWLVALSFRIFGFNTFAAHLPQAVAVLLLALLGYRWGLSAFNRRTAMYTGLGVLTSAGVFLFTRILIPEVLLSLFLAGSLFCFLRSLAGDPDDAALDRSREPSPDAEADSPARFRRHGYLHPYLMWTALALAVLTKGLVALVFFFGVAVMFLAITGAWRHWRRLRPFLGVALLLAIAAPWHIVAGLRNTGGENGHGFFWFYFINEHVLRFLGKRQPVDYNKLPGYLYWSLHLVWLFPWSLFAPLPLLAGLRFWRSRQARPGHPRRTGLHAQGADWRDTQDLASRTNLLLALYVALVLVFFSLSTNQEYYTFPVYLPMMLLIAAALVRAEQRFATDHTARHWVTAAHGTLTAVGMVVAIALASGLWQSRRLPFVADIGDVLAHRGVGDYTLSMSHFFDLTASSFAALRLPAVLAALAFATGPAMAWLLRQQRRHFASTVSIALTAGVFLVAAHLALIRFGPMLSSQALASRILDGEARGELAPSDQVLLYGDQAYGSSIPFYLDRVVPLVNGRSSSMLFGSTFPDVPPIFLTSADLLRQWGHGPRKVLFVPLEKRTEVDYLLAGKENFVLAQVAGKALLTDRAPDSGTKPVPLSAPDGNLPQR